MKRQLSSFVLAALLMASCTPCKESFTSLVDPSIGTGGHGHVFVGANVPFGMVQLGPTSIPQSWDWCSGYHESDSTIIGFSHTHLSGTGIGDLFDVSVMPVVGEVRYARGKEDEGQQSGLWSYGLRSRQVCRPGYYSIPLERYGILAELTATCRVGLHRYTFPESEESAIVIDLENGGCWDRTTESHIELSADGKALQGWRFSTGWAKEQKIFFYATLSKEWDEVQFVNELYTRICFRTGEGEQLLLKVALSPVSCEAARRNMEEELPGWDFDATAALADSQWNRELSRIVFETSDADARKIFYTSLYHTMIAPSTFCDVDGAYRGADGIAREDPGFRVHTTFSLWDTYRAAMPLYSIFQPERNSDFINTMLQIYLEQGKLPVWHLMGCETDCMVGNPGIPPVADALIKGCPGIERELAYEALKASALNPERGQKLRMEYGYIPCDLAGESVAYDLEYALADAAVAKAARFMADCCDNPEKAKAYESDAAYFELRSHSYKHLFDPELGFIRGKDSKGAFRKDYSPFYAVHRQDDYCEGNGWQYTWLVPHDLEGLCRCFGSKELLTEKLDSLFTAPSVLGEDASPDISGLIGQYAHGNEPSHHIIYFYTMLGQPWKTADKVREVLETLYSSTPDGLCGNEDVGQMSAWYIMSALGFYEVEPAGARYWFGSPICEKASIEVEGGRFDITVRNQSPENKYIRSMKLNGKNYKLPYISHSDIAKGGRLDITMGPDALAWY
ncbi:MAG: GH92 family glycosyl hydrolase [Candidatus Cryptobacteroides sp.]